MQTIRTLFLLTVFIAVTGCVSHGPSRYDGYDEVARTAHDLETASVEFYEQVQREAGYDEATRYAGELVVEARDFHRQVEEQPTHYEIMRRDFAELAEAYALAQNELATRPDLHENRRIADDFRDVELAFANLNDAIDYSSGHYYDRDSDALGYRDSRR
jgi:predicted membrane chloride channel (bestrophin family)